MITTTNLGELGWWRMKTRREFIKLKYWIHIILMNESRLVKQIYNQSKKEYLDYESKNWTANIHRLVVKYNLEYLWNNEESVINKEVKDIQGYKKYWKRVIKKQYNK